MKTRLLGKGQATTAYELQRFGEVGNLPVTQILFSSVMGGQLILLPALWSACSYGQPGTQAESQPTDLNLQVIPCN